MKVTEAPPLGREGQLADGELSSVQTFSELFDAHASAIYRLCAHRTGDLDLAHDLTSITFLEAWRHRDRMPDGTDRLPWLLGIAINVTRNSQRSRRRYEAALARLPRPPVEPDHSDLVTERAVAAADLTNAVAALDALPPRERDVITLVCWEELSYEQTAAALGIAVGTVRSRLSRGRRRLSELVANEEETS